MIDPQKTEHRAAFCEICGEYVDHIEWNPDCDNDEEIICEDCRKELEKEDE